MSIRTTKAPRSALIRRPDTSLTPGSARSLLVTILGELVWPTSQPVWTSALVYVLGGLGVEEQTARQAIARAAASDWIIAERIGREVSWSLSPKLVHIFEAGSPRVHSLKDSYSDWDGRWLTLFITIPNSRSSVRRTLYAGMTWAGFGNPTPGLWLSPHVERADELHGLVKDLSLEHHTVSLIGSVDSIGMSTTEIVQRGWDLDTLRDHYERLLPAISTLTPSDSDETLFAHIEMSSAWQELPREDPQLPEALLPDWIGRRVARRIEALRAQWTPTVRRRFDEINRPGASTT
jgi:phenylacetic acid degradation operon negative regulatory protein